MNEGYIYVLSGSIKDHYKIGHTKNLKRRLSALKTSDPSLQVDYFLIAKDRKAVEKQIHRKYSAKRVENTEWFKFTPEEKQQLDEDLRNIELRERHELNLDRFFVATSSTVKS